MVTRIQRWGNSLGLRIPKLIAQEAGLEEGSAVDISVDGDRLVIRPVPPVKYELKALIAQITKGNIHEGIETGPLKGGEVW